MNSLKNTGSYLPSHQIEYNFSLVDSLSQLNLSWEKFNIFRLEGNIYPEKKIALFSMDNIITKLPQAELKSEIMGDEYAQL